MNAQPQTPFDWRNPDYLPVYRERCERLRFLSSRPGLLASARAYYRAKPAEFISHFGMTQDPRLPEKGAIPFVLFKRQVELIEFVMARWHAGECGVVVKSRDIGMSWIIAALSVTLCLFHPGMLITIYSRKEDLVDHLGDAGSLFEKCRFFTSHLPPEFTGGWRRDVHSAHLRILFPTTSAAILGESGDQAGRGARSSLTFCDEFAFTERPALVDAALSAVTPCRIYCSTPNGRANLFAEKYFGGRIPTFNLAWRDDPRKDQSWYEKQQRELDPITLASEVDADFMASATGVLIPSNWVQAAIGAHTKLGITPSGIRRGALDLADEGADRNAAAFRYGVVLEHAQSWSGKGGSIYHSVIKMFDLCDEHRCETFDFDSDGLGAGARGDAERINADRTAADRPALRAYPFRGSGAVNDPESEAIRGSGRLNKDYFANQKAQAWFALRARFETTHAAVAEGREVDRDSIISIDPNIAELPQLSSELSQVTYRLNLAGKILIDKAPDGARSPNLADAVMIAFAPGVNALEVWTALGRATRT